MDIDEHTTDNSDAEVSEINASNIESVSLESVMSDLMCESNGDWVIEK